MPFTSDELAAREKTFKANEPVATAYVRGIVACAKEIGDRDDAPIVLTHQGRTVRNPYWSIKGEQKAVDPWDYYGRDFAASDFVTKAIAYVVSLPKAAGAGTTADLYTKGVPNINIYVQK
jgi:hypothetical protein